MREQILHGGGPAWLEPEVRVADPAGAQAPAHAPEHPHPAAAPGGAVPDVPGKFLILNYKLYDFVISLYILYLSI